MNRRKRLTFWGKDENDDSLVRNVIAGTKTATASVASEFVKSYSDYGDGGYVPGDIVEVYDPKKRLRPKGFAALFLILVGVSLWLVGCLPRDFDAKAAATPENAAGLYVYQWKSGHVESIALRADATYVHSLYPNAADFAGGKTSHRSEGRWFATSKGHGALNAVHLTEFYSMFDDQHLDHPSRRGLPFHEFTMLWNPFVESPRAMLQYSEDTGYWFAREADGSLEAKRATG
jgi:hypothetical protein